MSENEVRGRVEKENERFPDAVQGDVRNAPEPPKRKADDEWLAFATEDPAFFIKPSDAV
ncbi:MAG TPA: hypothetical protein VK869_05025 [Rubrobacteraceae bacterium]|nr:hypothetical protein [Rubrobacteraceae bacterium]